MCILYYEWSIRQEPRLHSTFFNFRSTNSSGVLSLSENQRNIKYETDRTLITSSRNNMRIVHYFQPPTYTVCT
jgi:hypothetical protein